MNRRNMLIGGLVVTVGLLAIDGLLGFMAGYATGNWVVGAAVFGALFSFTWLEFAVVGWAARRRQEDEKRRAES